jgi:hypothetical protein
MGALLEAVEEAMRLTLRDWTRRLRHGSTCGPIALGLAFLLLSVLGLLLIRLADLTLGRRLTVFRLCPLLALFWASARGRVLRLAGLVSGLW